MTGYQGWTNWETWNAYLWLSNEPGTDHLARLWAAHGAEGMRNAFDEAFGPVEDIFGTTPLGDAWLAYLDAVNWLEIAEAYAPEEVTA